MNENDEVLELCKNRRYVKSAQWLGKYSIQVTYRASIGNEEIESLGNTLKLYGYHMVSVSANATTKTVTFRLNERRV